MYCIEIYYLQYIVLWQIYRDMCLVLQGPCQHTALMDFMSHSQRMHGFVVKVYCGFIQQYAPFSICSVMRNRFTYELCIKAHCDQSHYSLISNHCNYNVTSHMFFSWCLTDIVVQNAVCSKHLIARLFLFWCRPGSCLQTWGRHHETRVHRSNCGMRSAFLAFLSVDVKSNISNWPNVNRIIAGLLSTTGYWFEPHLTARHLVACGMLHFSAVFPRVK